MPTDRPRDPLARLAAALAEAAGGLRPTPLELAEVLWLARQMEPQPAEEPEPDEEPATPASTAPPPPPEPEIPPHRQPSVPPARAAHRPPPPEPARAGPADEPRTPLHLPAPAPGPPGPYAALLAPAPPMLRHPLGLQRALRPLKRHTDAPSGHRLDEHATADRIARLGASPEWWLPVLRPAKERWLRLILVRDTGPTMPVWLPLVRELHAAVAQSGVFRTVTPVRLTPDGTVHPAGTHAPADGRTVTLVISDCMGPQWRPGPAGDRWEATLRRWCRRMPVAVVQPLPEHLWRDTALPAVAGVLTAPFPAAPAAALAFTPYDGDPARFAGPGAVPLPVLEAAPRWLANWAALLASAGGSGFPGSAAPLGDHPDPGSRTDLGRLSAEELVLRFRGTSSPEAVRLAGHLAVGRPDLPVMRLVQRAVEPDPRPQHLAEVILSGLLTTAPGPPGSYAFRPGVRDLLLRGLPRSSRNRTTDLLARTGGLIEERAGAAPGEFRAVTPTPGAHGGAAPDGEPFATVRRDSLRRLTGSGPLPMPAGLGGRYRLLRRMSPSGSLWLAQDEEAGRRVVLRLHRPLTDPERRAAFLRETEALKALDHPNVVTVHDFGIADDIPYVVMEHLDGIPLNALAAPNGYHLPAPLTMSVGTQLMRGLRAAHRRWVRHGAVSMSRVVLLPDGTVKLTLFEPGLPANVPRDEDLRALGAMMLHLATGSARADARTPLRHLPESVRRQYAEALSLLMSTSLRQAGVPTLLDEQLVHHARVTYTPRSYVLLGPVTVDVPDRPADLAPPARALLAMLLLRHGRTVTHDELRAGLWSPAEEPRDAMAALGRLASALREALGPGALATLPDGYALHTSADQVDLLRSEELRRQATELAEHGSLEPARDRLDEALRLWRGPGLVAGVPGPAARTARTRLLQLELALYRQRAELDLEMGEFERVARDLGELLHAYPARADFRRLRLLALQRLGRTEEALEVFEEYEESGGDDPVLLALGHELRRDHADDTRSADPEQLPENPPSGAFTRGPDDLPLGSFPTEDDLPSLLYGPEETPQDGSLPQDDAPESLFAAEDGPPYEDVPAARRGASSAPAFPLVARFELADGAGDPDDRPALGRAVVRLLLAAGLGPADYRLRAGERGYTVLLPDGEPGLRMLSVALRDLPDRMAETGGLRWRVTFRRQEDGDGREGARGLESSGAQGVVVVSDPLRTELAERGHEPARLLPLTPGAPADGWYVLVDAPDPATVEPVQGPFRQPAGVTLPGTRRTRTVVFAAHVRGFTLDRPSGDVYYYEVDRTERRLALNEPGPEVNGTSVFTLTGEAVWRIEDPVRALSALAGRLPSTVVAEHVRTCLRTVSSLYPPSLAAEAGSRLETEVREHAPSGYAVHWRGSLAPTLASLTPPPLAGVDGELAEALRSATAVLLGFDGVLTRLHADRRTGETTAAQQATRRLALRYGRAGRPPLDLLRERAGEDSVAELARELTAVETAAAREAEPVPNADLLVRTLAGKGLPLGLVTDCATEAVTTYLERRRLTDCLIGGVHGRGDLGRPLMPDPHRLQRAAGRLGVRPDRCLMIGADDNERAAALAAGMPFVHVVAEDLRPLGSHRLTSPGLLPLLRAAQSL
ncbi:SAV_2336 N-terminal domain-related protein [Streptomyces sp. NPDC007251]|uniref:SAV_2336 N-terminal domain-related protein n=1 Tax=Streptomyces sp. NPDC007251 TaxID=3154483 RepID=UPI0033E60121